MFYYILDCIIIDLWRKIVVYVFKNDNIYENWDILKKCGFKFSKSQKKIYKNIRTTWTLQQ